MEHRLHSFWTLPFAPQAQPVSVILVGDNGTGKSTIVDALEFALQGTFVRATSLTSPSLPAPISFWHANQATISVDLDDGTHITNRIWKDEFHKVHSNHSTHPAYGWCPIALRRKDILAFLNSPAAQRQVFFLDYFTHPRREQSGELTEDLDTLATRRIVLKKSRRNLAPSLAEELHVATDDVPTNKKQFDEFVREFVYKGLTSAQRKQAIDSGRLYVRPKVQSLLAEYSQILQDIRALGDKISDLQRLHRLPRPEVLQQLKTFLNSAAGDLSRWFTDLSSCRSFVESIELLPGELSEVSLSIELTLKTKQKCAPHQVLSEANLDLIALLLFISLAHQSITYGQEKLLILDDVLQSVDAVIRMSFSELLMREFHDWQLVFTVHDRMWHNQLRELFRRHNKPFVERQLTRWSFESGPIIAEPSADLDERVLGAIQQGDLEASCALCGLLLEAVCQRLSWVLGTSVTRRKEDKYTLGDLWPGVAKKLKKSNVATCAEDVDKWIHLRNLVGAAL